MRLLLHDYSGHPFQVQLSRELSRRGHDVVHSYCEAYLSGKGHLSADPGETLRFEPIGVGQVVDKMSFRKRLIQELRFGWELVGQARRIRPDVMMLANTPIPSLVMVAAALKLLGIPWVLWQQDMQAVAIESFAGDKLSRSFLLVARVIGLGEKWCARRAAAIVVITEGFLGVHRRWKTDAKTHVIPNWAPLDEIVPTERDNAWAKEHDLYISVGSDFHFPSNWTELGRHLWLPKEGMPLWLGHPAHFGLSPEEHASLLAAR